MGIKAKIGGLILGSGLSPIAVFTLIFIGAGASMKEMK